MFGRAFIVCAVLTLYAAVYSKSADAAEQVTIEHSFDGKTFTPRSQHAVQVKNEKYIATDLETLQGMDEFKALLDSNGLYHIRARFSSGDGNDVAMASLPACDLQRSGFREDITLHVQAAGDSKRVVGVAYTSPVLALARPCDSSKLTTFPKFQTKVHQGENKVIAPLPVSVQGPRPPMLAKVNLGANAEGDASAAEGATAQGQQSILRKYWYIVLPMVIFVLFGGGGEEPKKEGAAAAGAAPAAGGGAAPAPAAK